MEPLGSAVRAAMVSLASTTPDVVADRILVAAVLVVGGVGGGLTVGRDDLPLPDRAARLPLTAVGGAAILGGSLLVVAETFSVVGGATGALGTALVLVGFGAVAAPIAVVEGRRLRGVGYALVGLGFVGTLTGLPPSIGVAVVVVGSVLYFWEDGPGDATRQPVDD